MRLLVIAAILFIVPLSASVSDDLPYKTCEMKEVADFACSTREAMAGLIQSFAREDVYTRQKLLDSEVCITLEASDIKELRKYDAVKMPIFYSDYVRQVPVLWMKVKMHGNEKFFDVFMVDVFLKCK